MLATHAHASIDAFRLMDRLWATYFVPRRRDHVDVWAEANRILPRETSAEPGPFRIDRTPYALQIYRDLSFDAPHEDIVLMCATQLVKSEAGLSWLGWAIDQDPCPMMIVQATVESGKRYSRQRLAPMIKNSPRLSTLVREARSRESGNTTFMKEFPGGVIVITGANSAAGLASMPARMIHFDEVDDYPDDVDGQGEPTGIARARQDTFRRRKRLYSSSPKRAKGHSKIEKLFNEGTRFYFHVPCPHCGVKQRLVFERLLRLESGAAAYACGGTDQVKGCGALIQEHEKPALLAGGEWIADNPGARTRSYHLSSLYSPLGWLSWSALLNEYVEAVAALDRGDDVPMKTFTNTRLAHSYQERTAKVEGDDLRARADDYPLRAIPRDGLVVVAGVDVQDNRIEITLWTYGEGEEAWVIDYTVFAGDPAQRDVWDKLEGYLATRFPHADGQTLGIEATAIDTGGHFTHEVYNFCRGRPRVFAIRGGNRPGLPIKGKSSLVDVNWRGKIIKAGVRLWSIGVDRAKDLLHNRLCIEQRGPGYVHLTKQLPPEFFTGFASEERVRVKTAHGERKAWVKKQGILRNEPWDCSVYALFCAQALDLHRYTPAMWQRLRDRVAPVQAEIFRPVATPGTGHQDDQLVDRAVERAAAPVQTPATRQKRAPAPRRPGFVNGWKR
jgi:phage terminase large subunit GpA-like protein